MAEADTADYYTKTAADAAFAPISVVSDAAYDSSWNGVTGVAPSKNAVYDKIEALAAAMATNPIPAPVVGNWLALCSRGAVAAGTAFAANTIYYVQFTIEKAITLSDLGCRIGTLSAGGNLKLAIYANNASIGRPSGTPLAETASITTASTGNVSADITGSNVTLQPGTYWAAFWCDNATAAILALTNASINDGVRISGTTALNDFGTGTGQCGVTFSSSETYGTWPNATSETLTPIAGGSRNYVLFGKAA